MGARILSVVLVVIASAAVVLGIEHNLPEGVELVDPKDLGLDGQIDLDKLLGNVKALPIDGNALSSALGKPGLKTQVLTVGFDGSEGINLDDFELPHLKNDEHAPLAQAAFSSFKNFFKNSSMATQYGEKEETQPQPPQPQQQPSEPLRVTTHRPGGKRRTMMKRRKIARNGSTTTTTPPPQQAAAGGPKVIELDSSQIEKLIASGKIGPPKSLTPGGPQVIELGQKDLDALLSSENGEEIKQILEGGDAVKDFDLSQIQSSQSSNAAPPPPPPEATPSFSPSPRVTESIPPVSVAQVVQTSTPAVSTQETYATSISTPPPQDDTQATQESQPPVTTPSTLPPNIVLQEETTGLPIIYQYNSAQEQVPLPPQQPVQSAVPLQFYSSHANGQQQARLVKHPTFELISAPPVSFSSSVLPHATGGNINNNVVQGQFPPQVPQIILQQQPQQQFQQQQFQQPQQQQFQQPQQQQFQQQQQQEQQQQFRNTFITPQLSSQFIPVGAPPSQPQSQPPPPPKEDPSLNKILPAKQQSSHTEAVKASSASTSSSQNNYIQTLHKVNLPHNSVKLVTPSPQAIHSLLNQVPNSFQPSLAPNHVVNSPIVDPLRVNQHQQQQSTFLGGAPSNSRPVAPEPFRNTQLFNSGPPVTRPPVRPSSSIFRFPSTSSSIFSSGGPNRFRTAESNNPFYTFAAPGNRFAGSSPNVVLNSFVAGDGLNYGPRSNDGFLRPGI